MAVTRSAFQLCPLEKGVRIAWKLDRDEVDENDLLVSESTLQMVRPAALLKSWTPMGLLGWQKFVNANDFLCKTLPFNSRGFWLTFRSRKFRGNSSGPHQPVTRWVMHVPASARSPSFRLLQPTVSEPGGPVQGSRQPPPALRSHAARNTCLFPLAARGAALASLQTWKDLRFHVSSRD